MHEELTPEFKVPETVPGMLFSTSLKRGLSHLWWK